jgi:predicted ferric reductase
MNTQPAPALPEIPLINPLELIAVMLAFAGGALLAAVVLPAWLPGLSQSLLGSQPKAYWYLARTSGLVAYVLLWLSIVLGLVVSNKLVRLWNGGPTAVELHQFGTWLALAFGVFHALILLGDTYIKATLQQVLVPFNYKGYEPTWVGLGQIGFYIAVIVACSFYVRKQIGYRAWRTLHYVSFVIYSVLTLHGIFAGTDTMAPGVLWMYAFGAASVYFLLIVRVFNAIRSPRPAAHAASKSLPNSPAAR